MGVLTFKRLAISLFVLIVAMTGLVLGRFYWPALPHVNYEQKFAELCEQVQPADPSLPNVEPEFRLVLDEFKRFEEQADARHDGADFIDWYVLAYRGPDAAVLQQAEGMFEELSNLRQTGFFERTRFLAGDFRFIAEPVADMGNLPLVEYFGPGRKLANCLAGRLRRAIEHDDAADAGQALREILGLSRAVSLRPLLIDYLVSVSYEGTGMNALNDTLALTRPSAPLLRSLRDAMLERTFDFDMRPVMRGERLFVLAYCQKRYEAERSIRNADLDSAWMLIRHTHADQAAMANELLDLIDTFLASRSKPDAAAIDSLAADIDRLEARQGLVTFGSALTNSIGIKWTTRCIRNGTLTSIAIRLYEAEHGRLPASLGDLVPDALPSLPTDPFAPDGGFVYRPQPLPLPGAPSFTLYSVGLDAIDNGGTPGATAHHALSHAAAAGTDYIFGLPPASPPAADTAP